MGGGSEKCIECVGLGKACNLASMDTARWKLLDAHRRRLKEELREARAKRDGAYFIPMVYEIALNLVRGSRGPSKS